MPWAPTVGCIGVSLLMADVKVVVINGLVDCSGIKNVILKDYVDGKECFRENLAEFIKDAASEIKRIVDTDVDYDWLQVAMKHALADAIKEAVELLIDVEVDPVNNK